MQGTQIFTQSNNKNTAMTVMINDLVIMSLSVATAISYDRQDMTV